MCRQLGHVSHQRSFQGLWWLLVLLGLVAAVLVVATSSPHDSDPNYYYTVLGLKHSAEEKEIKKAFRQLSLQFHPDKDPSEGAQKKFIEIQEAYDVLSDGERRHIYDSLGKAGLDKDAELRDRGQPQQQQGMFGQLFGMQQAGPSRKGPDTTIRVPVTLEEFYNGGTRSVRITRPVICRTCKGTGAKDAHTHTCTHCHGRGHVVSDKQNP